ncbi:hypothetical protein BHM03_00061824 [Ensete ventricosum]|nr:hypothetical protein BHM03_00061824 [Ensete ventricosum]
MTHDDLAATSSLPRTTGPPTWPIRRGKLVGRRYGGASGRAVDLTQVKSNPQRSYGRPDTGKVDTLTCGRMPHRKDDGRGGGVRWHGKPQGQPGCQLGAASSIKPLHPLEWVLLWLGLHLKSNIVVVCVGERLQEGVIMSAFRRNPV